MKLKNKVAKRQKIKSSEQDSQWKQISRMNQGNRKSNRAKSENQWAKSRQMIRGYDSVKKHKSTWSSRAKEQRSKEAKMQEQWATQPMKANKQRQWRKLEEQYIEQKSNEPVRKRVFKGRIWHVENKALSLTFILVYLHSRLGYFWLFRCYYLFKKRKYILCFFS